MQKIPNPTDVYVGGRIRLRRKMAGLSQERLGNLLGITFQQIQKYEKGTNRVGASRLQAIAGILEVPVSYFFEQQDGPVVLDGIASPMRDEPFTRFVSSSEGIALNKAFLSIRNPRVRKSLISLAKSLADGDDDPFVDQDDKRMDGLRPQ